MKPPIKKLFTKRQPMPAVPKLRPLHFRDTRQMVEKAIADGLVGKADDVGGDGRTSR